MHSKRDTDFGPRSPTVLRGLAVVSFVVKVRAPQLSHSRSRLTSSRIGRQHLGALFNLVAYYVLALPLGITLAFHPKTHMGLQGLWIGMRHAQLYKVAATLLTPHAGQVVALFIVGLSEYAVVWLGTDWPGEIRRSVERNEAEAKRRQSYAQRQLSE